MHTLLFWRIPEIMLKIGTICEGEHPLHRCNAIQTRYNAQEAPHQRSPPFYSGAGARWADFLQLLVPGNDCRRMHAYSLVVNNNTDAATLRHSRTSWNCNTRSSCQVDTHMSLSAAQGRVQPGPWSPHWQHETAARRAPLAVH